MTMCAYDTDEDCEFFRCFTRYQFSLKFNQKNVGLYRDHGLAVSKNISGPQAGKVKNDFQNIINKNNLNVIVKCNLKIVDYQDITLNFSNDL